MKLTNKIAVFLLAVIIIAIYGASIGYDFIEIDDGVRFWSTPTSIP